MAGTGSAWFSVQARGWRRNEEEVTPMSMRSIAPNPWPVPLVFSTMTLHVVQSPEPVLFFCLSARGFNLVQHRTHIRRVFCRNKKPCQALRRDWRSWRKSGVRRVAIKRARSPLAPKGRAAPRLRESAPHRACWPRRVSPKDHPGFLSSHEVATRPWARARARKCRHRGGL